ncbi:hypothetical protein MKZ38_010216 [Zalerion maritima]|uniref:Uncharacterized protein n=1 Tax=Zalerion maritima TaxID=339359 RepID=A0AAD5RFR1_9PEZI|nr:hypothetical protein MKZ38_010216 [Zalerion maritima]
MLLRSSSLVLRRFLPAVARNGRLGGLALRKPLSSRLQVASMVSISRFEMERNPCASITVLFHLPNEPTADQKLQYISFHFWDDDEPADVAWTFTVPEGEDLVDVLKNYALSMGRDTSDEYVRAYQGYVMTLYTQKLLLQRSRTTGESAGSEKDVEIPKEGARRKSKTPVPAILLPGRARDEEIELRLQQGQSLLDLASSLERTSSFIIREAKRLLGEYELKKLMKQNKKGQWSNDEIRTKLSVEKQLRELGSTIFEPTAVEGPQEFPPRLQESLFNTQLVQMWQGLLRSEMTQTWREALWEKSAKEWLSTISAGIPEDVLRAVLLMLE